MLLRHRNHDLKTMKKFLLLLICFIFYKVHYSQDSAYIRWVDSILADSIAKKVHPVKKMEYPVYDTTGRILKGQQEIHAYRTPYGSYPVHQLVVFRNTSVDGKDVETRHYYLYDRSIVKICIIKWYESFHLDAETHYVQQNWDIRPRHFVASEKAKEHIRYFNRLMPALKLD